MQSDTDTGLPASAEIAWGMRDRPTKGPKRGLSLARIVDAAIGIAAADGLAAVSMSRVAGDLGASTMSLYRYVSAKNELLALMRDRAYGSPPQGVEGDWRRRLSGWAWAVLRAYRGHPWVLELPITGLPSLPNELAWMEAGLAATADTGLTPSERASVLLLVSGYVRNVAQQDVQVAAAFRAAGASPNEAMYSYANVLRQLADPQRFPAIREVVDSGVFDKADDPDEEFVFGLERVLDGVQALIASRQPTAE